MQLVEDPLNPDSAADGIAKVIPIFDETFQVLREEEVYPILSFVADIGGILGLFIVLDSTSFRSGIVLSGLPEKCSWK